MAPFDPDVQAGALCAIVSAPDRMFGFAVFYEDQRLFRVCEYQEDSHLSRTESLLLQVQPRSLCIMLAGDDDTRKLGSIADSCGVSLTEVKMAELKQVDVEQDLLRLLADAFECGLSRHLEEQRQKLAMRALSALLGHYAILNEPANFGACSLGLYHLKSFMYLDKAAFSALNVLPRPQESLRQATSILGFLNRCRSTIGSRRLRQWLTQPLTSPEEIAHRHDVVEAFCGAEDLLRQIEGHLSHVPDLEKIAARLHCTTTKSKAAKATIEDLVTVYKCIRGVDGMLAALLAYNGAHSEVLSNRIIHPLKSCAVDFQNFRALVEQTIDLKQAEHRTYCISAAFDVSLQRLATQRDQVRDRMEIVRRSVDEELNVTLKGNEKAVSLVECPEGLGLRVTKKHQQIVQHHKGPTKFKILSIKKMECIFTTPALDKLKAELSESIKEYDRHSEQLVAKALAVSATYSPVVERLGETLANLDVLTAFARVAITAPCSFVRPQIDPNSKTFTVKGAAHILVVANSDKGFIANDLNMDNDASRLHIITGPNMGGKSTYIRSIALIVLLNQIGCFVPCQSAVLPIFDSIMCRVGASDMQLRGISTFMAEMLEAACILNTATHRSLVIVDELGRGTSTSDGFGIAWAIARFLAEQTRCYTLFATHFHELAALEDKVQGVHNKHATAAVDAASGRLTFLYSLADGPADQSYGAHVAELADFPARVVEAARRRANEFEAKSTFHRPTKRSRVGEPNIEDPMAYILGSHDEDEFVKRSMEQLPQLCAVYK